MSVKDDSRGMDALERELAFLAAHQVRVGVLSGPAQGGSVDANAPKGTALRMVDVFSFHEFGTGHFYSDGPVSDFVWAPAQIDSDRRKRLRKMIKRIAAHREKRKPPRKKPVRKKQESDAEDGKPKTSVPRRSVLAWVMEKREAELTTFAERVLAGVLTGRFNGRTGLGLIGEKIVALAQRRIKDGIPPPLADSTILQKSRDGKLGTTPLIDTGQLINSLRYAIRAGRQ